MGRVIEVGHDLPPLAAAQRAIPAIQPGMGGSGRGVTVGCDGQGALGCGGKCRGNVGLQSGTLGLHWVCDGIHIGGNRVYYLLTVKVGWC